MRRSVVFAGITLLVLAAFPDGTPGLGLSRAGAEEQQPLFLGDVLNPLAFGQPLTAREIPAERTEKSAVFDLGDNKRAAVSEGSPLFAKDADGAWVPIREDGQREGDTYVFDRLPGGVRIRFDLTHPGYRLWQDGKGSFSLRFNADGPGVIESGGGVVYHLNSSTLLRWRVEGNHIKQEVWVYDPTAVPDLRFRVTTDKERAVTYRKDGLRITDNGGHTLFSIPAPELTDDKRNLLEKKVTLAKRGDAYDFVYDRVGLPVPYVLDPSVGPQNPTAAVNTSAGSNWSDWSTPTNVYADDGAFATNILNQTFNSSNYLDVTGFDFSAVPSGATIDGVVAEFDRKVSATAKSPQDKTVQLLLASVGSGNNYAVASNWPTTQAYASYGTGTTDKWGLTPTDTDVKSSGFGIRIRVYTLTSGFVQPTFSIDHIRMTVYYTEGAAAPAATDAPVFPVWSIPLALGAAAFLGRRSLRAC